MTYLKRLCCFWIGSFMIFAGCSNRFTREESDVQKSISEFLNAEPNDKFKCFIQGLDAGDGSFELLRKSDVLEAFAKILSRRSSYPRSGIGEKELYVKSIIIECDSGELTIRLYFPSRVWVGGVCYRISKDEFNQLELLIDKQLSK
jgi:hypothetical protein